MTIAKSHLPAVKSKSAPPEMILLTLSHSLQSIRAPRTIRSIRNIASTGLKLLTLSTVCFLAPQCSLAESPVSHASALAHMVGQKYELKLHHLHTGESLDVVYRIGNTYVPSALSKLNHFLRDHRTGDQSHYDPKEFDLLHSLVTKLGKANATIDVVCGYRTPETNAFLRTRGGTASPASTGVAQNSQHIQAKAIDIRIPGVSTRKLNMAALSLKGGGVGYYPISQFVHVDVGPVRHWTFAGHGED